MNTGSDPIWEIRALGLKEAARQRLNKVSRRLTAKIGHTLTPDDEAQVEKTLGEIPVLIDAANQVIVEELEKPVAPVRPTKGAAKEFDGHTSWWYQCGACETPLDRGDKYCRMCGREVKWDDD